MLRALVVLVLCTPAFAYPPEQRVTYTADDQEHIYLVQEVRAPVGLFIYAHGAGGLEEQGMSATVFDGSFGRLRALLAKRHWIYVTPRQPDFETLMPELERRYGTLPVVLAGASAGGRRVYAELSRRPYDYEGAILLCPAVALEGEPTGLTHVRCPVWIETGAEDRRITRTARAFAAYLEKHRRPHRYVEIEGGNHDDPVKQVEWPAAFAFVTKGPKK